ncbi:GAF domain-containing protein [Nocardioides alcanivorans]|uniref:GAF domain-containing protein n=1 Tax=Nocardioides alcanivorans TaxID=2897352 RepID=UPI001F26F458|nr:GAF domain-containing protein [Nocardioides alcanivorans]
MTAETPTPDDAALLLDAVVAIGSDLDLNCVLRRIIDTACAITEAKYGFLAVLGDDGRITDHVTQGMSEEIARHIAGLPQAVGLLGEITHAERPVRIDSVPAHPLAAGFPQNHPDMQTFLGAPVRIRGQVFGNLYLTEKKGGKLFTAADEARVEALAGAAGYVIDNARAFALSEMRRKWVRASAQVTEWLQAGDVRAAVRAAVSGARVACDATMAVLVVPTPEGRPEVLAVDAVEDVDVTEWLTPWASDIPLLGDGTPLMVRQGAGTSTVVLVWIRTMIARRGVLVIQLPGGRGVVDEDTAELVQVFADQASMAFDRAQSVTDRQEFLLVAERERIARDLHDVVIQRIFATGLQLQGLRGRVADVDVRSRLTDAVADLDHTIRDIRTSIFELNQRRRGSLRGELADLVVGYTPILGFTPKLRTSGPVDTLVPDGVANQMLAVLRRLSPTWPSTRTPPPAGCTSTPTERQRRSWSRTTVAASTGVGSRAV